MFSRSNRVIAQTHANLQKERGVRFFSEHISLRVADNMPGSTTKSKFSVVISKKVEKTAVARNKTRRRLYPIIKKMVTDKMNANKTFVFYVQKSIGPVSSVALTSQIDFLLKKAII